MYAYYRLYRPAITRGCRWLQAHRQPMGVALAALGGLLGGFPGGLLVGLGLAIAR